MYITPMGLPSLSKFTRCGSTFATSSAIRPPSRCSLVELYLNRTGWSLSISARLPSPIKGWMACLNRRELRRQVVV